MKHKQLDRILSEEFINIGVYHNWRNEYHGDNVLEYIFLHYVTKL